MGDEMQEINVPRGVLHTADRYLLELELVLRQCARLVREHVPDLTEIFVDRERPTADRMFVSHLFVASDGVHLQHAHQIQRHVQRDRHHHLEQNHES